MTHRAYTVASLAREWDCSEGVIRKAVAGGRLGCFRIGSLIRIPVEEVERFECQSIASSDSEAATRSSTVTSAESAAGSSFERPIALGLKRRQGGDGRQATVHHGPWAGS